MEDNESIVTFGTPVNDREIIVIEAFKDHFDLAGFIFGDSSGGRMRWYQFLISDPQRVVALAILKKSCLGRLDEAMKVLETRILEGDGLEDRNVD